MIAHALACAWYGLRKAARWHDIPESRHWQVYLGGCDCRSRYALDAARGR